jgi:outer membrane protein OmpA-like peptidoglycan-associated protein
MRLVRTVTGLVVFLLVSVGVQVQPTVAQEDINQILTSPPGTRGQTGKQPALQDDLPQMDNSAVENLPPAMSSSAADAANIALRTLLPPRKPDPFVLKIARTGFLVEVVSIFTAQKVTLQRTLHVREVVGPEAILIDLPSDLVVRDSQFANLAVVVCPDSIAVVERATRMVLVVIDKVTQVAVTTDPEFTVYVDLSSNRTIVASLIARMSKEVYFDFNKANLTALAREQLEEWGVGLRNESFRGAGFWIIGHTDRVGSDAYNLRLSRKRARAVVNYLQTFGLPGVVFLERGRGWHDLKFPDDPTDSGNRRVEIQWIAVF